MQSDGKSFAGKTYVVTGGTRGIGAGIAGAFLEQGARVIATFAGNVKSADDFRDVHAAHAERLETCQFDVSCAAAVEAFYADLEGRDIVVEGLVNNAGIRKDSIVGTMSEADWDDVLNTNLKGCYLMSKYAVRMMSRKRYGRIISVTSPSGRIGFAGQGNYAASKAGLVAFSKSLAKEVAKRKITVNCVSPGFIGTDFLEDLTEAQVEEYKSLVPLKRFGTVEEVAHAVLFLASPNASYITGTVVNVAGGL